MDTSSSPPVGAVTAAEDEAAVVAAERAQAEAERAQRASRRMRATVRDMVLSLIVVGGVVLLLAQPWQRPQVRIQVVPWEPVATAFASSVSWQVLAPKALPATWQSTSARIEPTSDGRTALHIGWLTPAQLYAALEQSDTAEVRYVRDKTNGATPTGSPYLTAGRSWMRLESVGGATRALVARAGPVSYVVAGSAGWTELEALAATLSVVAPRR